VTNGYRIFFGSEPDISILNPEEEEPRDLLIGAIEVKCGLDPAGALERYGAAKKSFEDRSVRKTFNLTKVFFDPEEKHRFLDHIRWLLHL